MGCLIQTSGNIVKVLFDKVSKYGKDICVRTESDILAEKEIKEDWVIQLKPGFRGFVSLEVKIRNSYFYIEKIFLNGKTIEEDNKPSEKEGQNLLDSFTPPVSSEKPNVQAILDEIKNKIEKRIEYARG
jgi:hypothetical protein